MENSFVFLIGLGVAAFFGFQGSVGLAVRHQARKSLNKHSPCDRVIASPYAFIGNIPIAYLAALYYAAVLGHLLHAFLEGHFSLTWMSILVITACVATCFYAYILFFKIRAWCMGCIRIYIANIIMGLCLLGYYLGNDFL